MTTATPPPPLDEEVWPDPALWPDPAWTAVTAARCTTEGHHAACRQATCPAAPSEPPAEAQDFHPIGSQPCCALPPETQQDVRQHRMDADCWCQPMQADNGAWDHQ